MRKLLAYLNTANSSTVENYLSLKQILIYQKQHFFSHTTMWEENSFTQNAFTHSLNKYLEAYDVLRNALGLRQKQYHLQGTKKSTGKKKKSILK